MSEWISVKDRLPDTDTDVLVYLPETRLRHNIIRTDWIYPDDKTWYYSVNLVTHWMPLPEPPVEKTKEGLEYE